MTPAYLLYFRNMSLEENDYSCIITYFLSLLTLLAGRFQEFGTPSDPLVSLSIPFDVIPPFQRLGSIPARILTFPLQHHKL